MFPKLMEAFWNSKSPPKGTRRHGCRYLCCGVGVFVCVCWDGVFVCVCVLLDGGLVKEICSELCHFPCDSPPPPL
jgi:hypothetical protein